MNELIILGIVSAIVVALFAATALVENTDRICEWLFDVQTAYYKFKQHRKNKQYLNTRKETKL